VDDAKTGVEPEADEHPGECLTGHCDKAENGLSYDLDLLEGA